MKSQIAIWTYLLIILLLGTVSACGTKDVRKAYELQQQYNLLQIGRQDLLNRNAAFMSLIKERIKVLGLFEKGRRAVILGDRLLKIGKEVQLEMQKISQELRLQTRYERGTGMEKLISYQNVQTYFEGAGGRALQRVKNRLVGQLLNNQLLESKEDLNPMLTLPNDFGKNILVQANLGEAFCILSHIQIQLIELEYNILRALMDEISLLEDSRSHLIRSFYTCERDTVYEGEIYRGKLHLAKVYTGSDLSILLNGESLPIKNGLAQIKIKNEEVGETQLNFDFIYRNAWGIDTLIRYEKSTGYWNNWLLKSL